ncbi:MAG: hypothetical protein EBS87_11685 [Sphingomonadaceae bacterium]|nr:hypothetical protein [Sphingomonadaceae bacterium]NCA02799.1 hypothetical protein [Sphingomonadaceae bacterium]
MTQKHCQTCGFTKPIEEFWKGQSACVPCSKYKAKNRWNSRSPKKRLEQHLRYKYGISHSEFQEAWDKQSGNCAICEDALPDLMTYDQRRRGYAIDHNHETGDFRGVLCLKCNSLLGMASDSIDVLHSAIRYLSERGSYANVVDLKIARKGKD